MKTPWKNLDPPAQQALMQRFANQALAQDWIEQLPAVRLRQLYAFALNAVTPDKDKILLALQKDEAIQRRYLEILHDLNAAELVNTAADSTEGDIATGQAMHWRYRLKATSAKVEELKLIVEIASGAPPPSRLFAKSARLGSKDIILEKARSGFIRMVFPNTDLLVNILSQADREVRMW